jgi:hypothetical protein
VKITKKLTLALLIMGFLFFGSWAYGETSPAGEPGNTGWEFIVAPYFWMAGLEGDVGAKGITTHINYSFSDIFAHLDYGGEVHMEGWKGRWGLFFDATYLKLSGDEDGISRALGPVSVDVDMGEWLVEFGGLYRLARWPLGKDEGRVLSLEALGGGRYWDLSARMDATAPLAGLGLRVDKSKDWVDPIIGARLRADLTKKLSFALRGDIGGFGVGSDFTWNASAIFGYHFSPLLSTWLGYRALGVDYESGSGTSKFTFDVTMYGPIVGVSFQS